MKVNDLSTLSKKFSRQVAAYEAAGLDPDMELQLPFAENVAHFLNVEALSEAGIDALGLARQMDQVLVENIGNNLSQKVKAAVKAGRALPGQEAVDAMLAAYDFTGLRAQSDEGMSTEERTVVSEIRKAIRKLISGGTFASLGANGRKTSSPADVVFNAVRVQTGPEAEGKKPTPAGSVPLENFEMVVQAAFNSTEVEFEDGNGSTANLDFSIPPVITDHGKAGNLTGVVELARQEAARIIERNKQPAAEAFEVDVAIAG